MTLPNRPIELRSMPPEQLAAMVECVAAHGAVVDAAALEADVLAVLHASGLAHDASEAAQTWHDLDDPAASHKELARGFLRLAEATDLLDPAICTIELFRPLKRQVELRWSNRGRGQGRGPQATLALAGWNLLNQHEQAEVRQTALHLAGYHKSFVRAERPRKNDLDTIMGLLADVFVQHSGFARDRYDLPHSLTTAFIRFVEVALDGIFDPSEVSPVALARRWKREKLRRRGEAVEVDRPGAQIGKRTMPKAKIVKPQKPGWRPKS